jgi:hypothetical protein
MEWGFRCRRQPLPRPGRYRVAKQGPTRDGDASPAATRRNVQELVHDPISKTALPGNRSVEDDTVGAGRFGNAGQRVCGVDPEELTTSFGSDVFPLIAPSPFAVAPSTRL